MRSEEVRFLAVILLFGFFFSREWSIMFFNSLEPYQALFAYYAMLGIFLNFAIGGQRISIGGKSARMGYRQILAMLVFLVGFQSNAPDFLWLQHPNH